MKIKYEVEDLCVGCPQGCRHCGRGKTPMVVAIECDICGEDAYEIYQDDDGYNMCMECLLTHYTKVSVDDIAEDTGAYFDEEWEEITKESKNGRGKKHI